MNRCDRRSAREHGFTLLEVLIAFTVLSIVMSAMSSIVGRTLGRLSSTRIDQEAIRLGEQKVRELTSQAAAGEFPEIGVEEGIFEGIDERGIGYAFRLEVEPYGVPIPRGVKPEQLQGSGVFSSGRSTGGAEPAIRRVTLRVYPEGEEAERALPFVLFITEPAEAPEAQTPGGATPDDGSQDDGSQDGASNGQAPPQGAQ